MFRECLYSLLRKLNFAHAHIFKQLQKNKESVTCNASLDIGPSSYFIIVVGAGLREMYTDNKIRIWISSDILVLFSLG